MRSVQPCGEEIDFAFPQVSYEPETKFRERSARDQLPRPMRLIVVLLALVVVASGVSPLQKWSPDSSSCGCPATAPVCCSATDGCCPQAFPVCLGPLAQPLIGGCVDVSSLSVSQAIWVGMYLQLADGYNVSATYEFSLVEHAP